jgi:uncharacterized membrane protein YhhN
MDLRRSALRFFFAVAALVIGAEALGDFPALVVVKPLPVLALCLRLALTVPPARSARVLWALGLGALGDLFMALSRLLPGDLPFLLGMGAFLVGHLCYIAEFARELSPRRQRLPLALLLVVLGVLLLGYLWPGLGPLRVPVAIYAATLVAMAVTATFRASPRPTAAAGATLFVVSDALIAIGKFAHPVPLAGALIFITYYAAQLLLEEGWARDQPPPRAMDAVGG